MPAKNRIKTYVKDGYYYIYNVGVDKRNIFLDDSDYLTFLKLLKTYLSSPASLSAELADSKFKAERPYRQKHRLAMNLSNELKIHAYCLMPNNFQIVVQQFTPDAIVKFMRRLNTSYVTYFNKRYRRIGNLYQGVYKGALLNSVDEIKNQIHVIHQSPLSRHKIGLISTTSGSANEYPYSSFQYYIANSAPEWLTLSGVGPIAQ